MKDTIYTANNTSRPIHSEHGRSPIADGVEGVPELLSRNVTAVAPVLYPAGDLAQRVVAVRPIGTVRRCDPRALVDRAVFVGGTDGQRPGGLRLRRDRQQPVHVVVALGRDHARRPALR
jgi:hypothetical protein